MTIIDTKPDNLKLRYVQNELRGLRKVFEHVCAGDEKAAHILIYLKSNYKEWDKMVLWLKQNNLRGKKLVEFFQNESPDGGGYLLGATYILNKLDGKKNFQDAIKVDRLH